MFVSLPANQKNLFYVLVVVLIQRPTTHTAARAIVHVPEVSAAQQESASVHKTPPSAMVSASTPRPTHNTVGDVVGFVQQEKCALMDNVEHVLKEHLFAKENASNLATSKKNVTEKTTIAMARSMKVVRQGLVQTEIPNLVGTTQARVQRAHRPVKTASGGAAAEVSNRQQKDAMAKTTIVTDRSTTNSTQIVTVVRLERKERVCVNEGPESVSMENGLPAREKSPPKQRYATEKTTTAMVKKTKDVPVKMATHAHVEQTQVPARKEYRLAMT